MTEAITEQAQRVTTISQVLDALRAVYPESLASDWDTGIGLTCGDAAEPVTKILMAVDPTASTVAEAIDVGAQLLVTHHPLLFRPVQSVSAGTGKGALVHQMIRAQLAHFAAHTNADRAAGGVNDALAAALGLIRTAPIEPAPGPPMDKLVLFVPVADAERLTEALAAAGAGRVGDYADAAFVSEGTGQFRPLPGAQPAIGVINELTKVPEQRIEMVLPRAARQAVIAAIRVAHPYQEPAFDLTEMLSQPSGTVGLGRLGQLRLPVTLAEFTDSVARSLPVTAGGVKATGDPNRMVSSVAVCGGAGGSLLGAVAEAGADVFVTADLSHHVAAEYADDPAHPALVDVAHWASEWPWLNAAAQVIELALPGRVETVVSTRRTDPWVAGSAR